MRAARSLPVGGFNAKGRGSVHWSRSVSPTAAAVETHLPQELSSLVTNGFGQSARITSTCRTTGQAAIEAHPFSRGAMSTEVFAAISPPRTSDDAHPDWLATVRNFSGARHLVPLMPPRLTECAGVRNGLSVGSHSWAVAPDSVDRLPHSSPGAILVGFENSEDVLRIFGKWTHRLEILIGR
jgi:hypothetical protein